MNIEGIKEYYENEYKSVKSFISNLPYWTTKEEVVNNALQRLLGVAQCAQYCGMTFDDANKLYSEYRMKFVKELEDEENV